MKSMRILRIVKMTNKEYLNKLQEYQTSDAPVEVRQKDIDALNKEYNQDGAVVFKDKSWLGRGEYDGSEWWKYKTVPTKEAIENHIEEVKKWK